MLPCKPSITPAGAFEVKSDEECELPKQTTTRKSIKKNYNKKRKRHPKRSSRIPIKKIIKTINRTNKIIKKTRKNTLTQLYECERKQEEEEEPSNEMHRLPIHPSTGSTWGYHDD